MIKLLRVMVLVPFAAIAAPGAVSGRIVFHGPKGTQTPGEVRADRKGEVKLELRQGEKIFEAKLEDDGRFLLTGAAGDYTIDRVSIAGKTISLDPYKLTIADDKLTCAGFLEATLPADLNDTERQAMTVTNDCDAHWEELKALAPALTQTQAVAADPLPVARVKKTDYLAPLRDIQIEGGFGDVSSLRLTFLHPVFALDPSFSVSAYLAAGAVAIGTPITPPVSFLGWDFHAGLGARLGSFDFGGYAGYFLPNNAGARQVFFGGFVRARFWIFGIGARSDTLFGSAFFLDIAPLRLLGTGGR
jgi:hypothetical protein